jgi:hippurate hydrolase
MAVIGMRPPGNEPPAPCHSNRMKIDESGMAHGAALHAAVALRYLAS